MPIRIIWVGSRRWWWYYYYYYYYYHYYLHRFRLYLRVWMMMMMMMVMIWYHCSSVTRNRVQVEFRFACACYGTVAESPFHRYLTDSAGWLNRRWPAPTARHDTTVWYGTARLGFTLHPYSLHLFIFLFDIFDFVTAACWSVEPRKTRQSNLIFFLITHTHTHTQFSNPWPGIPLYRHIGPYRRLHPP